MSRCLAAFLALLCASLAVSSACSAAENDEATRRILYGDLDLSTPDGLKTLNRRINHALDVVCLDPNGPSPAAVVDANCRRNSWQATRRDVALAIARQQSARATAEGVLVRHFLVRDGDLDLSTATGVKALDRRIDHALNLVCAGYSGPSAAGTVDPDCKTNGRRAVLPQKAAAVARQKSAEPGIEAKLLIGAQPNPARPLHP
jgi:UrcA family protein